MLIVLSDIHIYIKKKTIRTDFITHDRDINGPSYCNKDINVCMDTYGHSCPWLEATANISSLSEDLQDINTCSRWEKLGK